MVELRELAGDEEPDLLGDVHGMVGGPLQLPSGVVQVHHPCQLVQRLTKCFLRVHAAWSSPSPAGGCWSSANGLPTCDSTWVGVIVRAHRSASATRSTSAWRRWVWVTLRRKARHSHSMRLASGS